MAIIPVPQPPDNHTPASESLGDALRRYEVELSDTQCDMLDRYRVALWEWNEKLNLTRHTTFDKFVARDVVDCVQLSELLGRGERVLDVGTGGGVPGVPLAILRPDLSVSLCESTAKKARAVTAIVASLGLEIQSYHARAEEVLEGRNFNSLVARAVAPLEKFLRWFAPHWDVFDRLLLIKGPAWVEERARARHVGLLKPLELRRAVSYKSPDSGAESVILSIRPNPGGENSM